MEVKKVRGARGIRAKGEAKCRDPEAPLNTWSGRGKPPRRLQDKVNAGEDKERFKIDGEAPRRRGKGKVKHHA